MGTAYDWSTTASSNGNADATVNFIEGQLAPTLNNSSRALMARVKAWLLQQGGVASGGSSNAYTYTSPSGHAFSALVTNSRIAFKANHTNTGAATLAVDGLTATAIRKKDGATALDAGDIQSGQIYEVVYDGTYWQLLGGIGTQQDSAVLQTLAALTDPGADRLLFWDDSESAVAWLTLGSNLSITTTTINPTGLLTVANNLSDVTASTARTNLGLGTAATVNTGTSGATIPLLNGNNTFSGITQITDNILRLRDETNGMHFMESGGTLRWIVGLRSDIAGNDEDIVIYRSSGSGNIVVPNGGDLRITTAPSSLATNSAGFRGGGDVAEKGGAYTFALSDSGKMINYNDSGTNAFTIPPQSSVVWIARTWIMGANMNGTGSITLTRGAGVVLRNSAGTDGNITVGPYQMYAIYRVASDTWFGRVW